MRFRLPTQQKSAVKENGISVISFISRDVFSGKLVKEQVI